MKILLLDIEISPALGYTWGPKFETNIIEFAESWYILSCAWKWLGGKSRVIALDTHTEKDLLEEVHEQLSACDVAVAHNGDQFDFKKLNTRFLYHGIAPPPPFKTIDTRKVARQRFGFYSNSLNDLSQELGFGEKMHHEGFSLWKRCMAGERVAFKIMKEYNLRDVELLERLYLRFLPFIGRFPMASLNRSCPRCKSSRLQSRGVSRTLTMSYSRFQCQSCGGWSRDLKGERVANLVAV